MGLAGERWAWVTCGRVGVGDESGWEFGACFLIWEFGACFQIWEFGACLQLVC